MPREVTRRRLARWQKERRRRRITLAAGALVIAAIVIVVAYGFYATSIAPKRVRLATVGETHLTATHYLNTMRLQPGTKDYPRDAFTAMVDYELINQGAAQLGLHVSQSEVLQEMHDAFTNEDEEELTDAELQRRLAETLKYLKVSREQFEGVVATQILVDKIEAHATAALPEAGTPVPQVHLRHVDVPTELQAQAVLQRLEDGEDFASLVEEFEGDDPGWLPQGLMSLEIERWAFAQTSGYVTRYFHVEGRYAVVQVVEPVEERPLAEETLEALQANALAYWLAVQWDDRVTWEADDETLMNVYFWALEQIL